MAAELIQKQPAAIQLRYLQTLVEIGSEKNTTVVFPLPVDMFTNAGRVLEHFAQATTRGDAGEAGRAEVISRNGAASAQRDT
jgi:hypothetical protein